MFVQKADFYTVHFHSFHTKMKTNSELSILKVYQQQFFMKLNYKTNLKSLYFFQVQS